MATADNEKLIKFMDQAQTELEYVVSNLDTLALKDVGKRVQSAKIAWDDAKRDFSIAKDELQHKKMTEDVGSKLEAAGLTGVQLDFKLNLHQDLRTKLDRYISRKAPLPEKHSSKSWTRSDFRRLLESIENLLDSLSFFSWAEPVKEIIEAIKIMI